MNGVQSSKPCYELYEQDFKKMLPNFLIENYKPYIHTKKAAVKKLVLQNNLLISRYLSNKKPKNQKNKPKHEQKYGNKILKLSPIDLIIPKGRFCFPTNKSFRVKDPPSMEYMHYFESLNLYNKIIPRIAKDLKECFVEYPKIKDDSEKILNEEYIIYCFLKILISKNNKNLNISMMQIIEILALLIRKKAFVIYKIISNFLINLKKNRIKQFSLEDSKKTFSKLFCNICFKYSCNLHTAVSHELIDEKFKTIMTISNKESLDLKYFNKFENKNQAQFNFETYFKCKDKCSVKKNSLVFQKSDDQFLILLYSKIFNNNCLISNLLVPHLNCNQVRETIQTLNSNKNFFDSSKYQLEENEISLILEPKKNQKYKDCEDITYIPCSHKGLCTSLNCRCIKEFGVCELFCNCKDYCNKQFSGCQCTDGCKKSLCPCALVSRECDPDICKGCKFDVDKYRFEKNRVPILRRLIKKGILCQNMDMTLNLTKKVTLGNSTICNELGLFALEDIEEGEYIIDYTGELISQEDAGKRCLINDLIGLNYQFKISDNCHLDAIRVGNDMRYSNHSSYGYENCYAIKKYVRCIYRVALFSLRKIEKGEELFFDYNIKIFLPWLAQYDRFYKNS